MLKENLRCSTAQNLARIILLLLLHRASKMLQNTQHSFNAMNSVHFLFNYLYIQPNALLLLFKT
jgi:hypothetical protein